MLFAEFNVFLPQGVDTINHGLDKTNFGVSKTMLVGNVISVSSLSTRFTTGSTGLNGKLFASGLKGIKTFLGPSGEVDVDGGSHASSKIGWARVNVTELFGQLEVLAGFSLDGVLYSLNTSVKILKIYVIESFTKLHETVLEMQYII